MSINNIKNIYNINNIFFNNKYNIHNKNIIIKKILNKNKKNININNKTKILKYMELNKKNITNDFKKVINIKLLLSNYKMVVIDIDSVKYDKNNNHFAISRIQEKLYNIFKSNFEEKNNIEIFENIRYVYYLILFDMLYELLLKHLNTYYVITPNNKFKDLFKDLFTLCLQFLLQVHITYNEFFYRSLSELLEDKSKEAYKKIYNYYDIKPVNIGFIPLFTEALKKVKSNNDVVICTMDKDKEHLKYDRILEILIKKYNLQKKNS